MYHYAGNNPINYTDPDGRAHRVPVTPDAVLGTKAHNSAYDKIAKAIYSKGYSLVYTNKGMYNASGTSKINRKRPDAQVPNGTSLLLWELKPSKDVIQAKSDIEFYVDEANKKGVKAEAGEKLGWIAGNVPVKDTDGIFMDIYSNEDGVILYDLYRYEDDDDDSKKTNWKVIGGVVIIGGVLIVGGVVIFFSGGTVAPAAAAAAAALAA